jgi:queuosine precursor transporter
MIQPENIQTNSNIKFKYLGILTSLYITFQLVSDATAGKLVNLLGYTVSVTVIYFPITFIFADVLTEVYGYARARKVLWTVMLCSIIAGIFYALVASMPPAPGFDGDAAYKRVFGVVPRLLVGGWTAVFAGEIANDIIVAKLKVMFAGKYLWIRTISSTVVGQLVNTAVFYIIGLYGILPPAILLESIIVGWILKVIVEVIATPVTYIIVNFLKREEKIDYYDRSTNFNPFTIKD